MRKEITTKSKSLGGTTDLTFLTPIKKGFVPSLDSVTYKTRLLTLLRTLNAGRSSTHEYLLIRPLSDAVERTARIHAVRVLILDDKVLLAVTFDNGWDSYIRVLWKKVGRLLDSIFCNTEGYVSALDHRFDEWAGWVESIQQETNFFYGMPQLTVKDVEYLKAQERLWRERGDEPGIDLQSYQFRTPSVESETWLRLDDMRESQNVIELTEVTRIAGQSLVGLYGLSSLYPPGTSDGRFLIAAAQVLQLEFLTATRDFPQDPNIGGVLKDQILCYLAERFPDAVHWINTDVEPTRERPIALADPAYSVPLFDGNDVQAGLVKPIQGKAVRGALIFVSFGSPKRGSKLLDWLSKETTSYEKADISAKTQARTINCSLTFDGLRSLGMRDEYLELFPREFREGMAARSSVLGDFRSNHPRRWKLPESNWTGAPSTNFNAVPRISLASLHLCIEVRFYEVQGQSVPSDDAELLAALKAIIPAQFHDQVLGYQAMQRTYDNDSVRDHFGYRDHQSNPRVGDKPTGAYDNRVQLGELLLGYSNAADPPSDDGRAVKSLMKNGSFLVIRKLHQDVRSLEYAVEQGAAMARPQAVASELVFEKMMGRDRATGAPSADPANTSADLNDFDYSADKQGGGCPFHAHVRRANPRLSSDEGDNPVHVPKLRGERFPRILRRGMSYGQPYNREKPEDPINDSERGLMFMAYNASICEQFEVVQNWLSGGNSTDGYSGEKDPFVGVQGIDEKREFRFTHQLDGKPTVVRVNLDSRDAEGPEGKLIGDSLPFVRLEWGAYFFVPSIGALGLLAELAKKAPRFGLPYRASKALSELERLEALETSYGKLSAQEAWKEALEDPKSQEDWRSASLLAAVRKYRGGITRIPGGALVASGELVREVLDDPQGRYSVSGYARRMARSIGPIYLGLDAGSQYDAESSNINAALMGITEEAAFDSARKYARAKLKALKDEENNKPNPSGISFRETSFGLREIIDHTLQGLCQEWFGLPDYKPDEKALCEEWNKKISHVGLELMGAASDSDAQPIPSIIPGTLRWDQSLPTGCPMRYPGDFTAPSRYIFQPWPTEAAQNYGEEYGQALTRAMTEFVETFASGVFPKDQNGQDAPISKVIFETFAHNQPVVRARSLVGVLMGMLPTLDGALKQIVLDLTKDNIFWELRRQALEYTASNNGRLLDFVTSRKLLSNAIHLAALARPVPEAIWRTVTQDHWLGDIRLRNGDTVVLSLASASHEALEAVADSASDGYVASYFMFGGNRKRSDGVQAPTHACPAYDAARGAILGVISALADITGDLRPTPAPLSFRLEFKLAQSSQTQPSGSVSLQNIPTLAGLVALTFGDSWLRTYPISQTSDLPSVLQGYGCQLYGGNALSEAGKKLAVMATGELRYFEQALKTGLNEAAAKQPRVILLSGGGNDLHDGEDNNAKNSLKEFLIPLAQVSNSKYVSESFQGQVQVMMGRYKTIIDTANRIQSARPYASKVPIVVHGYGHPTVDARWRFSPDVKSWLWKHFKARGYFAGFDPDSGQDGDGSVSGWPPRTAEWKKAQAIGRAAMKQIIDPFNEALKKLAKDYTDAQIYPVVFIDLRQAIDDQGGLDDSFDNYSKVWQNELHLTRRGFAVAGKLYEAELKKLLAI